MKRALCVLLSILIVCMLPAGCGSKKTQSSNMNALKDKPVLVGDITVSFPLVKKEQTLNIMITGFNGKDQENVYVWKKYEEMTGVNVDWTTVSKETRSEAYHNALTNGQQYDLIMRCKISAGKLLNYGRNGLILDLAKDDLLKENAPNCWAYLQSHPDALASVMNPDGTIYALPQVNSGAELRVGDKIFVNKKWLDRVGMELPTTTEELKSLLAAFKEQDANGNGDPNDEIPMSVDWGNIKVSLMGAFGLANRGFHNESMDCDPVTGKVRLIEGCEQYRKYLEYFADLYKNELIDKNLFELSTEQVIGNIATDRTGVFASTNLALLPVDKTDDWIAIDRALAGPDGDQLWSPIRANFHSTGAAVIPATCSDPKLVLRWLDYFWTDEGTMFYHMGTEGETFIVKEDGTFDYVPAIYEKMKSENLSFDEVVSDYSPYPGGSNPTVETAPYFMGGEMAQIPADAARALMEYGPKEYWPSFTFTQEENEKLDEIKGDLNKYCDSMCINFVTGKSSFDEWDEYIAQLDKMGAQEKIKIYQAAVDRYHTLTTALN